jgi:hypothetical protein
MRLVRLTYAMLASLLLAACASYEPPTTGPTAKLAFANASACHFTIKIYEQSRNCVGRRKAVDLLGRGIQVVTVPAVAEITFQYAVDLEGTDALETEEVCESDCVANARFTPQSGASYIFTGTEGCNAMLERFYSKTDQRPVQWQSPKWRRGFNESSSFCSR